MFIQYSLNNSDNKWPLYNFQYKNRVSTGQGKVREIPDWAKVREKSGNFSTGQRIIQLKVKVREF